MTNRLLDDLRSIVGNHHVLVDDDVRSSYETDWTGRYTGRCAAVVRPATAAETGAVVAACNAVGVVVVPQAGNTGLVGGGVPRSDGSPDRTIVLSMQRLAALGPVDRASMLVTAGAGVTIADWRTEARASGLDTPVDFAARDSATVGGAIATNAGGARVLRFGTMRQQVVGIEAVMADGSVIGSLNGLPKETAGLHLPSLLAGSEGTLAVITAARLRLVPWYRNTATALVALESFDAALTLLGALRQEVSALDAVEVIGPAAMDLVAAHLGTTPPITAPENGVYLMIDCADHADPSGELGTVLASANGIIDTAMTLDGSQRDHLVAFRDRITEAIAAAATAAGTPTFKLDVAVPLDRLTELLDVATQAAATDDCRLISFGHLAEGNLHLNHIGANDTQRLAETVLEAVASLGGTISAEHGIGVAKAAYLPLIRSEAELTAHAAVRKALDPNGTLNPGVLRP